MPPASCCLLFLRHGSDLTSAYSWLHIPVKFATTSRMKRSPSLERRSRNRKEEIDKKSWGWLAQENHTSQEEKDATNPLEAPGRTFRARRADCEEDSESKTLCVFAPAPPRIAGWSVSARAGESVSQSGARATASSPGD